MTMQLEIEGRGAVAATEELLAIEELEGSYEIPEEVEKAETLVTIATIVGIVSGTMTIAEKLYQWNKKYQNAQLNPTDPKIEKVMLVTPKGRLLLKDASVEQIKEILED
ncbi:hypothetical protein POG22_04010 [Geitlerinema sp. CS-897]|nr:hypothetical protein [Geitlerinema sp. CS-897]